MLANIVHHKDLEFELWSDCHLDFTSYQPWDRSKSSLPIKVAPTSKVVQYNATKCQVLNVLAVKNITNIILDIL